jgi:hypothetical protein
MNGVSECQKYYVIKRGLISDSFSLWLKSPKKRCQITVHLKKDAQGCDLAPLFGDSSHSEKLYEIKSPLSCF